MAWVRFTEEHWHRFNAQAKKRYRAGTTVNVPSAVANKAVSVGHAVRLRKRGKGSNPVEEDHGEAAERR